MSKLLIPFFVFILSFSIKANVLLRLEKESSWNDQTIISNIEVVSESHPNDFLIRRIERLNDRSKIQIYLEKASCVFNEKQDLLCFRSFSLPEFKYLRAKEFKFIQSVEDGLYKVISLTTMENDEGQRSTQEYIAGEDYSVIERY